MRYGAGHDYERDCIRHRMQVHRKCAGALALLIAILALGACTGRGVRAQQEHQRGQAGGATTHARIQLVNGMRAGFRLEAVRVELDAKSIYDIQGDRPLSDRTLYDAHIAAGEHELKVSLALRDEGNVAFTAQTTKQFVSGEFEKMTIVVTAIEDGESDEPLGIAVEVQDGR